MERPALDKLIEESRKKVLAMTPAEVDEMLRVQLANVAPYRPGERQCFVMKPSLPHE